MKTKSTAEAIETFLADRPKGGVVSLADAVTYVRLSTPTCELLDEELANIISWCAARNSCNIHFDLQSRDSGMESGWRIFSHAANRLSGIGTEH